jgi:hypothetical protein
MSCRDLVSRLPAEHQLYLNPAGSVPMTVQTAPLLAALAEHEHTPAEALHDDEAEEPQSDGPLRRDPAEGEHRRADEVAPAAGGDQSN